MFWDFLRFRVEGLQGLWVLGLQDLEFHACSRLTTASVPTSTTAVERFPHADTEEPIESVALELPGLASHGRTAAQQEELPRSDTTTVRKYCAVLGNIKYHRVQYCIVYCSMCSMYNHVSDDTAHKHWYFYHCYYYMCHDCTSYHYKKKKKASPSRPTGNPLVTHTCHFHCSVHCWPPH